MISTCLTDGSWSPVRNICRFSPSSIIDSFKSKETFNINHMSISSMIIIGILSGIIMLLLALIVVCFHYRKTFFAFHSQKPKSKPLADGKDSSVSITPNILLINPLPIKTKCGVIVYDDPSTPNIEESEFHKVLNNYSLQGPYFNKANLTTFDS